MTNTTLFLHKLKEHEALIRYAAKRYRINGVIDPEDLYQEGLLILHETFEKYDLDPYSDDFRKMFKTELWHGLWKVLHRTKARKRDHRATVVCDFQEDHEDQTTGERRPRLGTALVDPHESPGEALEALQDATRVSLFVRRLYSELDPEAQEVLDYLINPPSWEDIPKEFKCNKLDDEYWRTPKRVPQHVTARMLGLSLTGVRRAIKRIRKKATLLSKQEGMDLVAAAGERLFGRL